MAFDNLEDGMALARNSAGFYDQIWVAEGTYVPSMQTAPPDSRSATFRLVNGVRLYGGFSGVETSLGERDPKVHRTILSGDLGGNDQPNFVNRGENSYRVVDGSGTNETAILDGFEICGGSSTTNGGGIQILNGSSTIVGCAIYDNNAIGHRGGGGLHVDGPARIINCHIFSNTSNQGGGALSLNGAEFINCLFVKNQATESGTSVGGGAVIAEGDTLLLNCTIYGNNTAGAGSAVRVAYNNNRIINCILWGNGSQSSNCAIQNFFGELEVRNTTIQGGVDPGICHNLNPSTTISSGINTSHPLFVYQAGLDGVLGTLDDDFRLRPESPCIDAGNNQGLTSDFLDLDGDGDTNELLAVDLDGVARQIDNPSVTDTGIGNAPIVDQGPYETSSSRFFLFDEPVSVPEGGTRDVPLRLAWKPVGPVSVSVEVLSGDPDITIQSGGVLAFTPENFSTPQSIVLAAAEDEDSVRGIAEIGISSSGYPSESLLVTELDDDQSSVIYVNGSASPGGDGTNWGMAFDNLEDGMALARNSAGFYDQIWVAEGTYVPSMQTAPPDSRSATFRLVNGVRLYGGFSGVETSLGERDPKVHRTILSGDLGGNDQPNFVNRGENSYWVVEAPGADETAVLDGFEVCGGNSYWTGGGIHIYLASPTIVNCAIYDNMAVSNQGGGGLDVYGAAKIINCRIFSNTAPQGGGALSRNGAEFINCLFVKNQATASGTSVGGGAVIASGDTLLLNCTMSQNATNGAGSAVRAAYNNNRIYNCILWNNGSQTSNCSVQNFYGQLEIHNTTIQGGVDPGICHNLDPSTTNWSNINSASPLFVNPAGADGVVGTLDDDFSLQPNSPGIDAGSNLALTNDFLDLDDDGDLDEPMPIDVAGVPRQIDVATIADAGVGSAPIVDHGAFEFASSRFFIFDDPTSVPEGGSRNVSLRLAWKPSTAVPVTVQVLGGDPDITIQSGGMPTFTPDNFAIAQSIVLAAAEDEDSVRGVTEIGFSSPGYPSASLFATELDVDQSSVIYVNASANHGGDGSSWELAFDDLEDAFELSRNSGGYFNEIWAAEGTYHPSMLRDPLDWKSASFKLSSRLRVYGGFSGVESSLGGRDPRVHRTILSGDLMNNDQPNWVNREDNIYQVVDGSGADATAVLDGFEVHGGNCPTNGGGIYILNGWPQIVDCSIYDNKADDHRGGGGMYVDGPARITNCHIFANTANQGGGALCLNGAKFVNCLFVKNQATQSGTNVGGGAVIAEGNSHFYNCTMSQNATNGAGAAIRVTNNSNWISNCILWNNGSQTSNCNIQNFYGFLEVHNTTIQGGVDPGICHDLNPSTTNLFNISSANPLFVNPAGADGIVGTLDDDFSLLPNSPCIDAGDNDWVGLELDFEKNARRVDDPNTPDTGVGLGPLVDQGVLEFGSTRIPSRLYVSADSDAGQTGMSWPGDNMLALTLDTVFVSGGDVTEVWVARGTYSPDPGGTDRGHSFQIPPGVSVIGGFAGTETSYGERDLDDPANTSYLSGDLQGNDEPIGPGGTIPSSWDENSYHVVTSWASDTESVLDGFTITGGNANDGTPAGVAALYDRGAAINLYGGRPTLRNIIVAENFSLLEGGGFWTDGSFPQLEGMETGLNYSASAVPSAWPAGSGFIPVGSSVVLQRGSVFLSNPLNIGGGTEDQPQTMELRSARIEGPGGIVLGNNTALRVSSSPYFAPSVLRTSLTMEPGAGIPAHVFIEPEQTLVLESGALVDLSGAPPGSGCGDVSLADNWGTIAVEGTLLVKDSTIQNTNVSVRLGGFEGASTIINNDCRLINSVDAGSQAVGFGGEFFVEGTSLIQCNVITSDGDRYLDLDPDPTADPRPTIGDNKFYVVIKQGATGDQGELLELRTEDLDLAVGGGLSGAFQLPSSVGYDDTWVLEQLEILPDAKVNLTNRPGFVFQDPQVTAFEALYVKEIKLHPGAVLNTGLQRMYYQTLVDENDAPLGPPDVDGFLANGAQLVDTPLLGFSLKIIGMEDDTEFAVRVRPRVRDSADMQPPDCEQEGACREGSILRITDPADSNNSVMEMKTHADGMMSASSVAAHGAFARAGEDQIVVAFKYNFCGNLTDDLILFLSDSPEAGENRVEVARIQPPNNGPGSIGSSEFATFSGLFPRGSLNFRRGTYVELELVGQDAGVLIDEWDPLACGSPECGDFDLSYFISNVDMLYGLTAMGNEVGDTNSCLDRVNRDNYVDVNDVLLADVFYGYGVSAGLCASNLGGSSSTSSGTAPVPIPAAGLLIGGKSSTAGDLGDRLYPIDPTTGASGPGIAPPVEAGVEGVFAGEQFGPRGHGRLIQGGAGELYQLHSVLGLVRLSDGQVMVAPGEGSFNGDTIRLGMPSSGSGLPIFDADFDPNDPTVVYVVPARVNPPSGESDAYYTAAKLSLSENAGVVTWTVQETYGFNPQMDPNNNTQPPQFSQSNVQYLREIETDAGGNLYVTCARADNQNDWLLIYDEAGGNASEQRIRLSNLATPLRGPAALHVTNDGTKLYLGTSLDEGDPMTTTVQEFVLGGNPGAISVTPSRVIQIGNMRFATSIAEDGIGTIHVVGYTAPDLDPSSTRFNENDSLFTTPTLAVIPPTGTSTTATTITGADAALPISAVFTPGNSTCLLGDVDGSGTIDLADVPVFVDVLLNGSADPEQECRADANQDGNLDGRDISRLVAALTIG